LLEEAVVVEITLVVAALVDTELPLGLPFLLALQLQ
jgi:hypothetical protein